MSSATERFVDTEWDAEWPADWRGDGFPCSLTLVRCHSFWICPRHKSEACAFFICSCSTSSSLKATRLEISGSVITLLFGETVVCEFWPMTAAVWRDDRDRLNPTRLKALQIQPLRCPTCHFVSAWIWETGPRYEKQCALCAAVDVGTVVHVTGLERLVIAVQHVK